MAMIIGLGNITVTTEQYNFDSFQIISVQIIYVIIYRLISMFKNIGKDVLIPTTFNIGSLCLCIASFILEIEIFMQENIKEKIKILSVICMILILFIIMYLYDLISKSYIEKMQAKIIEREKNYYYRQAELMQQGSSALKTFQHDINNHLYTLSSMIKEDNKEVKRYLEELTGKLEETSVYSNSGNIALDSIINYKLSEAQNKNIKVSSNIVLPENLNAEMEDMVTILGNILDNAIEATEKIKNGKYIDLSVKYKVGTLFITLINSYDGNIIHRKGKLQTRKSDDTVHGIGVKSVESTVNKYNGIVKINYDEKEFRVKIMLYI
ncbi:MAG: ATP-binding protein [Eubacterium sp.]